MTWQQSSRFGLDETTVLLTEAFEAAARLLISGQIEVELVRANVTQSEAVKVLALELASLRKSTANRLELLENELTALRAEVADLKKRNLPHFWGLRPCLKMA